MAEQQNPALSTITTELEIHSVVKTSSLVLLTHRFVDLLRSTKNNMIDLTTASKILNIKKRRIYDITNVLEGVGLLERIAGTHCMRLIGDEEDNKIFVTNFNDLEIENNSLRTEEKELDTFINYAEKNLKLLVEDPVIKSFTYITRDDLLDAFGDRTLLTVQNSKVHVQENNDSVRLKTGLGGHIDVRLVTEEGKCNIEDVEIVDSIIEANDELRNITLSFNNQLINSKLIKSEDCRRFENDETDEEETDSKEIKDKITANLILSNLKYEYSLKRFISDDSLSYVENESPLLKIRKPGEDYLFSLRNDEGLCELFDIEYPS